jgi:hypothetical protein
MIKLYFNTILFFALALWMGGIHAQQEIDCDPLANLPITQGDIIVNYGSATNVFSLRNRSSFTVGQPDVGSSQSLNNSSQAGFWARFLSPPLAPVVMPSPGEFPDRVLVKWSVDPLSAPSNSFVITRDGAFLAEVDGGIRQFIDFNVQAGEFYTYGVYGRSQFGNGTIGREIGFVNPNGVVSGSVETLSGNPVPGAVIKLLPTIGRSLEFDGISDNVCITYTDSIPTDMWTVSTWVRIGEGYDKSGIIDLGSDLSKNFWIHTTRANQGKGVIIGVGNGTQVFELEYEFPNSPNNWQHIAATYASGNLLLYVNGEFVASRKGEIASEPALFTLGCHRNQTQFYKGWIDDVRLFNRPLTSTEIFLNRDITVSKNFPGLVAYWKMDEGLGERIFDLSDNKIHGFVNGAKFSSVTPSLTNAGTTDESGFYSIQGINYSNAQTFTAIPSKIYYEKFALEMNAAYESYATLVDFDLPDSAQVEVTFRPFDANSRQSVLSKGAQEFDLFIEEGKLYLMLNGEAKELGPVVTSYQHLSFAIDAVTGSVQYYKDGAWISTLAYANAGGEWLGKPWTLGAKGETPEDFFTGLIDDVAFFSGFLPQNEIQLHALPFEQGGVDAGNPLLLAYFSLDEGEGTEIEDYGPFMLGKGTVHEATFSIITIRQKEYPHEFRPSQRIVNINPSTTAASGVDFVDESTIPISGVVRFENTFCYQDSVEILVNGQRAFPRIFTDANGRFVADFEPGASVVLTPEYGDHTFLPAFVEYRRINRPISGVLLQNTTKREIVGQMAGNEKCRLSVIPDGAIVKVKVQALNDCFSRELRLENADGRFSFKNLPPIPFAVSVTEHSNNIIYEYFQVQGGQELDMRNVLKDTADFIYVAPPKVFIQPFTENGCAGDGLKMIEQTTERNGYREYSTNIRVFELYDGGTCFLDTFHLTIENEIADAGALTISVSDTTTYEHKYFAGAPNLGGDYTKFIQVTANVNGALATEIERVVVLGERSRESTFTTASPAMPLLILRDPPGDGSSSTLAEGKTHCNTWSNAKLFSINESLGLNVDLGAKVTTYAGTPFGGVITEAEQVAEIDLTASIGAVESSVNTAEFCVTNDIEYSTSDGADVFFGDADLYVGAAINFEFSATDVLSFDPSTCDFELGNNVRVWPEGFGTKYIYSQWQIETDVIPSLEFIGDTASADTWRRIIQYNKDLKAAAVFRENLTFDALTSYTQTFTTSSARTEEFSTEFTWNAAFNETIGFEIFGAGSKVSFSYDVGGSSTTTSGSSFENNRSVSFTLNDDDPNDNFTIDVLDDPIFSTPVFRLRSGESMCPWEPGTLNREEVGFSIDRLSAVNVPPNEPAVFRLTLTNLGQTGNDPMVYILGLKEGSNPDGAIVAVDGFPLAGGPIAYQIQPFQSLEILLTVRRGPTTYSFKDIGIFMASQCQWEHARGLGYDLAGFYNAPEAPFQAMYRTEDLQKFYQEYNLNVEYIEPCSPVDIGFPLQDWVVTPDDGDRLFITLNQYLYQDPQLKLMRVQYRRTGGDGSWINIVELDKSEFANDPVFKIVQWDLSELADGPYEIRAVTECFDVSLNPGISTVVKGRKETQPPLLFGVPQPSDGVLDRGDEISIQFSKRINCSRIFPADGIGTNININNLALLDMTDGGVLVDAIIACNEDKIVITPRIPLRFLENHTLRVVVDGIEDLYGNPTGRIQWEFVVNQSALYWVGGDVIELIEEGNELLLTREIRNQGGTVTTFNLVNIPEWVDVFPVQGSVVPGGAQQVTFRFPKDLFGGFYFQTMQMQTIDGNKPLNLDLRVICPEPDWSFDPSEYSFSMNLTLELSIEGELSTDRLDHVAAFVNGELRGKGYVEYSQSLDRHLIFLTVYSNESFGETIRFQVWDADVCLIFGDTEEIFTFVSDGVVGSPLNPQRLNTNNTLLRKVYFHPGWNWFSYNLELPDPSINEALSSLTNPQEGLIKGQTQFSTYFEGGNLWVGNLEELSHLSMYQYRSALHDSLLLLGAPVDAMTPIPVVSGWNWIGYLPQRPNPVDRALESLTGLNGDIIKSQLHFAQYVQGIGWIGNLNFLNPLKGYLLKMSLPGQLIYPAPVNFGPGPSGENIRSKEEDPLPFDHWTLSPEDFEYSMNAIAIVVESRDFPLLKEGDEVGAFVNDQVRGSSKAIYIPALDQYYLFLTLYANQEGERMEFRYYNSETGEELRLNESIIFQINRVVGAVEEPFEFTLGGSNSLQTAQDETWAFSVFPNPAKERVYLNYILEAAEEIEIIVHDARGREMLVLREFGRQGQNLVEWEPAAGWPEGIYLISLKKAGGVITRKLMLQR